MATINRDQLAGLAELWSPPEELASSPTPRKVRITLRGKFLISAFAALFCIQLGVAASTYRSIGREQQTYERLARAGESAEAQITKVWSSRQGKATYYYAHYIFSVDRREYQRDARLSWNTYQSERTQPELHGASVTYLTADPSVSRLAIEKKPDPVWTAYFFLILGPVLLFVIWSQVQKQLELLRLGIPAAAQVTGRRRVKGGWQLKYDFIDESGMLIHSKSVSPQSPPPEDGTLITVIYWRAKPTRSEIYPMGLAQLG